MSLKLNDITLIGKTYSEYLEIFDLNEDELYNKKILDIAGGVNSFCAEANLKDIDVVAIDKIYSFDIKKLKDKSQNNIARNLFLYDYETNIEHYQIANLPKINFRNNSFDLALISHILVDYKFYKEIILQALRVAKEVRVFSLIEDISNDESFKNFKLDYLSDFIKISK